MRNAFQIALMGIIICAFSAARLAQAQTTAFTYQGRLLQGGSPANGKFDIKFTGFNAATNGQVVANTVTNSAIVVNSGAFITTIDFGPGAFTGSDVWLELAVSTNLANSYTTLAPRQQVTPVPFALYSGISGVSAGQSNSSLKTIVVDSNGVVVFPPNFFGANSNQVNSIVSGNIAAAVNNLPTANITNSGLLAPNDFISIRYKASDYYFRPADGNQQLAE